MVHATDVFTTFSSPIELPDIQDIEKMEKEKSQAIESLEISKDRRYVKCQYDSR